jgi:hypothetical protein
MNPRYAPRKKRVLTTAQLQRLQELRKKHGLGEFGQKSGRAKVPKVRKGRKVRGSGGAPTRPVDYDISPFFV